MANKAIILLSDGTGNSAASAFKTNVRRLYQALDLTKDDQVAFYDDGVGTSALKPFAAIGGAFGFGLKRNVKQLYKNLCQTYQPGDSIYAFGFSRGAFTIRVLVGLIASQGIIKGRNMDPQTLRREVKKAYKADRKAYKTGWRKLFEFVGKLRKKKTKTADEAAADEAAAYAQKVPEGRQPAKITFVGVWDTVDAYGLPIDELKRGLDRWLVGLSFPDQNMSPIVQRACHAVALDDKRRTFHPVLWNEKYEDELLSKGIITEPRLTQVWFAGMHADVGGGYAKDGLAHISLKWMMDEALAANAGQAPKISFHPAAHKAIEGSVNINGEMANSRAGLGSYYRYDPRRVQSFCNDSYNSVWIKRPKIHHSVFDRIRNQHVTYIPHTIPPDYEVIGPNGKVIAVPPETSQDAIARCKDLERAWDLVWWRRVVYLATIFVSAVLVLFPWIWETPEPPVCTGSQWCSVEPVVVFITKFLPSWLDDWVMAFRMHPGKFLLFGLLLVAVMLFGSWLEKRIEARATEAWSGFAGLKRPVALANGPLSRIARRARTTDWLVGAYRWTARDFLPFVCFLGILMAGFVAYNKLGFEIWEALGGTCEKSAEEALVDAKEARVQIKKVFRTDDVCFATGVKLLEGRTYVIEFKVTEPWIDGTIPTTPRGFSSADGGWLFRLAAPLRRSWTAQWFEPVGRIDVYGRDRYELSPRLEAGKVDEKTAQSRAETVEKAYTSKQFIAHNTGELFLFANDVVIALPWVWSWFYTGKFNDSALCKPPPNDALCKYATGVNNKGTAEITIRVSAPPSSSQ
jgi:uncharacterized protein (DUF2235 family)